MQDSATARLIGSVGAGLLFAVALIWPNVAACQELLWGRQFGTEAADQVFALAADCCGSIYVVGSVGGERASVFASPSNQDAFLHKYDSAGALVWIRLISFSNTDSASDVAIDAAGDIIVAGRVAMLLDGTPVPNVANTFIRKYDAAGELLWSVLFGANTSTVFRGVTTDANNNIYLAGHTLGASTNDAMLLKLNSAGAEVWFRQSRSSVWESANAIVVDVGGNSIVVGNSFETIGALGNAFLRKYGPSGTLLWSQDFGTSGHDVGTDLAVDGEGNLYLTGTTDGSLDGVNAGSEDAYLRKYDSSGTFMWGRQFGTDTEDDGLGVSVADNGDVYVSGSTDGSLDAPNQGRTDAFMRRYSPSGEFVKGWQFGTIALDWIRDLTTDLEGNVIVAGTTQGELDGPNGIALKDGNAVWPEELFDGFLRKYGPVSRPTSSTAGIVNAGSFQGGPIAPGELISIFGVDLSAATEAAAATPLPTQLADTAVLFEGVAAPLLFVSPGQINLQIPEALALGSVTVAIKNGTQQSDPLLLDVGSVAPGLFSHPSSGDPAIAVALTIATDGSRTNQLTYEPEIDEYKAIMIPEDGDVFLLLFGTGIRGHSGDVVVEIDGISVPVFAAVAQGEFVGLDQVNVGPLPLSLADKGVSSVVVTVDAIPSNSVTLLFAQ